MENILQGESCLRIKRLRGGAFLKELSLQRFVSLSFFLFAFFLLNHESHWVLGDSLKSFQKSQLTERKNFFLHFEKPFVTRKDFNRTFSSFFDRNRLWKKLVDFRIIIPKTSKFAFIDFSRLSEEVEKQFPKEVIRFLYLSSYMCKIFAYFWEQALSAHHYLVPQFFDVDTDNADAWCSTGGMGFVCASYILGIEKGWVPLSETLFRLHKILSFFDSLSGKDLKHGFLAHFYELSTGDRAKYVEYSTLDTAWLIMGILLVKSYVLEKRDMIESDVSVNNRKEIVKDIVDMVDRIYDRVEWSAAESEGGFLIHGWDYDEFLLTGADGKSLTYSEFDESYPMYILSVGSSKHPISRNIWSKIDRQMNKISLNENLKVDVFGEKLGLFAHIYPLTYLDMRDYFIKDFVRSSGEILFFKDSENIRYFDNAKKVTYLNYTYTKSLGEIFPEKYSTYINYWGLSAVWSGFNHYDILEPYTRLSEARVAPSSMMGTIVFDPDLVFFQFKSLRERKYFPDEGFPDVDSKYGFVSSFTLGEVDVNREPVMRRVLDIDKGAELLMLENYLTGFVWQMIQQNSNITDALDLLGFLVILSQKNTALKDSLYKESIAPRFELFLKNSPTIFLKDGDKVLRSDQVCLKITSASVGFDSYELEVSSCSDFSDNCEHLEIALDDIFSYRLHENEVSTGSFFYRLRGKRANILDSDRLLYTNWSPVKRLDINVSSLNGSLFVDFLKNLDVD
ncbi:hypothetical protein AB834_01300 [PVC group bacterium (ex Bugula neritina AB1)]|nr:hypothetical protein AB834_01300 [PVC group bacterium (ex Bugula neritina AB1)]